MTDIQVAALGFLLVAGIGLIVAARALHRINAAHRLTARYQASVKAQAAYLLGTPAVFRAGPFDTDVETGDDHTCGFGDSCARNLREAERRATAARVRGA